MNPLGLNKDRFVVADGGPRIGLVGVGQVKVWPGNDALREVRSLVVIKELRGRGTGEKILQYLLGRFKGEGPLYLLTIGRTISFYERAGFKEVQEVPRQLQVEHFLGNIVARLAARDRCLCMIINL
eukprot:SM000148S01005  [mRNA]  locus=s148:5042:6408:+ [translate_table: standard]